MSRPESKNVFYFPHFTNSNRELDLIEHKHGSEGYKAYYRLLELVADADYHRLLLKTQDDKDMFELGMKCQKEVVDDVIRILLNRKKIDKELWENDETIWMQDFLETLKPVYVNRRKKLPEKNDVSTCRNTEKRKEKKTKEKKREENYMDSLLKLDEYEKMFPDKNISKSLKKYTEYADKPNHKGAIDWLKNERNTKPVEFNKTPSGFYVGYCSKCGEKQFPNDKWQLRLGSECCRVEYLPQPKKDLEINNA